ncbi:MAG: flagellar hook-associated protein FlgK [Capsulimonadaceae bacterium]|nr:flagellar hook-associated protein FlgK [Capsulimonadaceae bacterium]
MSSIGTFTGYNIGKSALVTSSNAEDVVGNNVANANTDGYSVENLEIGEAPPVELNSNGGTWGTGQFGTGVHSAAITRARDQFLDGSLRDAYSRKGAQDAIGKQLGTVEAVVNEPGDAGINNALNKFFDAFNDVENNPEDVGVRTAVIGAGQELTHKLRVTQSALDSSGQQIADQVNVDVSEVNGIAKQIADLNAQIRKVSSAHQQPNMLLDQRDLALDKLAKMVNIRATAQRDGTVSVNIGGTELVAGDRAQSVKLEDLVSRGHLKGGTLGGDVQALASLTDLQNRLDNLSNTMMGEVNAVHASGAGLDGSTGLPFLTGSGARDIDVNENIVKHPEKLAAAAIPETAGVLPAPGDASNAVRIFNLKDKTIELGPLTGQTMAHFYNQTVTDIGTQAAGAKSTSDLVSATVTQLETQRSATSSVNIDEEATKLIQYQRSYQAAAKVISTNDEMLNSLLGMVR